MYVLKNQKPTGGKYEGQPTGEVDHKCNFLQRHGLLQLGVFHGIEKSYICDTLDQ
jgi:hypothetical protein